MTIDTEQLQMDLNNLLMQAERENADFAQQVFIRKQIREATAQLAQSNSYALDVLIGHVRAISNERYFAEADPHTAEIAQQYAPTRAERLVDNLYGQMNGGRVQ